MSDQEMRYTDDMREISGFGGGYEEACRRMALVGARHLIEHVDDVHLAEIFAMSGPEQREHPTCIALDKCVGDSEPGCSGAMHGAACSHAWHIRSMGWADYAQKMRELKAAQVGS